MTVEIIVSGHLCIDLIPAMGGIRQEMLGAAGRLLESGPLALSTGGAVSNTGLALHKLGVDVGMMAAVGDDLLGRAIIAFLEDKDPRLAALIRKTPGSASSYSVVLSPENADRTFLHYTGTNATFGPASIDFDLVAQAKLFHLGYPPILPVLMAHDGAALTELFRRVKAAGVVTSMDMALPDPNGPSGQADWRTILTHALPHVDVFLPSIEEALFMLRRADYDAWQGEPLAHVDRAYVAGLADELIALGAVVAGVKLGALGLYVKTAPAAAFDRLAKLHPDVTAWAGQEAYAPAFQVEVAGTTGAGDAAYAGFLAALLWGKDPQAAIRWANAVSACNVEAADATSGLQDAEAVAARLVAGWAARPERLPGF